MKTGDLVRIDSWPSIGVTIKMIGFSPFYGNIWEVFFPISGRYYSLGEFRLKKINEKNT
jgi:hypothetical protein